MSPARRDDGKQYYSSRSAILALTQTKLSQGHAMNIAQLKKMDAGQLLELRAEIDHILEAKVSTERNALLSQLAKLDSFDGTKRRGRPPGGGRSHPLRGKTVAPKFRGPDGETWTGRGLRPKWLTALIEEGHQLEEFAIGDEARATKKNKKAQKRK
jgi:DNA-binding protein H-NS